MSSALIGCGWKPGLRHEGAREREGRAGLDTRLEVDRSEPRWRRKQGEGGGGRKTTQHKICISFLPTSPRSCLLALIARFSSLFGWCTEGCRFMGKELREWCLWARPAASVRSTQFPTHKFTRLNTPNQHYLPLLSSTWSFFILLADEDLMLGKMRAVCQSLSLFWDCPIRTSDWASRRFVFRPARSTDFQNSGFYEALHWSPLIKENFISEQWVVGGAQ